MARSKTSRKASPGGGRGSKEAIEKRRVARQLNALLAGGPGASAKVDGRTEKRRRRLIGELKDGRGGQPLKPIDFLSHIDELLELGETLASIKKQGVKPRKTDLTADVEENVARTQHAYAFRPSAWKMLGLNVTADGSVLPARGAGTGRGRKKASKKGT
ncbi:MAG TPA: hypothetical protein RMF84_06420 [Polyangiaceae bacterium LLY-WYZ-14_1]|nr:hypothetical protein [Polyangiaceae bacterium LLY-WYZ-14_1]